MPNPQKSVFLAKAHWFPFDIQTITQGYAQVMLCAWRKTTDKKEISYETKSIKIYDQAAEADPIWRYKRAFANTSAPESGGSGNSYWEMKLTIIAERRVMNYILKLILPLNIIVLFITLTFWIGE